MGLVGGVGGVGLLGGEGLDGGLGLVGGDGLAGGPQRNGLGRGGVEGVVPSCSDNCAPPLPGDGILGLPERVEPRPWELLEGFMVLSLKRGGKKITLNAGYMVIRYMAKSLIWSVSFGDNCRPYI